MGWLRSWRTNRAAKDYGRRMGPWLQRSFGRSDRYAAGQIRATVTALKLDRDFIGLGFAAFLRQEEFEALRTEMTVPFGYDDARALSHALSDRACSDGHTPAHSGGDAIVGN